MDEVDDVLDRLVSELESRDRRIAELEGGPMASDCPIRPTSRDATTLSLRTRTRRVAELVVTQDVNAPAERVWSALVDWDLHGDWMLLTRATGGAAVGSRSRRSPASVGSGSSTG